jgi:predicted nucleotidyltransferase component of viral defense system
MPDEHAGGKWSLRYQSAAGQGGNLEVDLNFMFRVPLWPVTIADSYPVGTWQATQIPLIDIHELAAGKLAALLARRQARDLYDTMAFYIWEITSVPTFN